MGYCKSSDGNDRGDRARAVLAFIAALVIAHCALIMGTNEAFAVTVRDDGNGYKRAIVYPHDYPNGRYAALAEFLGYDWDSFSQQTKAAIIEDDGKFMELYRARCKNYRYENQELQDGSGSVIGILTTKLAEIANSVSETVFGNDKTWYCSCTNADYDAARDNIEEWLYPNDGNNGGSGGNIDTNQYVLVPVEEITETELDIEYVAVKKSTYDSIQTYAEQNVCNIVVRVGYWHGNSNNLFSNILACKSDEIEIREHTSGYGKSTYWPKTVNRYTAGQNYCTVTIIDGHKCTTITSDPTNASLHAGTWDYTYPIFYTNMDANGNGTAGEPYEPTPDPTPTPPVIQIGDVTVDLSNGPYTVNNVTYTAVLDNDNNWTVQVTTNTTNNYGGDVQASDSTDYTSILNAILAAINSLRSELTTYTNQINSNITTAINSLNNSIKNVETTLKNKLDAFKQQMHQDIQTLQTNLQNNFNGKMDSFANDLWANMAALDGDLIDEMDAVARYIVESMDFVDSFSDTNIVKWLKLIYSRLGSQPVIKNPTEDPTGWLDDLKKLLETILETALAGVDTAALSTLWNTAKTHFPLSLPWDMLAIVGLLAHEPITPAVDYPIVYDGETIAEIEFDLSEYDDVAEVTRKMSLIVFAMGLLITYPQIFHTLEPLTKALRG